jgi:hypothetical protein
MMRVIGLYRVNETGWRKLRNEGLHNLYSSSINIRFIKSKTQRWVEMREAEGQRQLGRPKRRCEDEVKTVLKQTGCEDVEWIQLDHDKIH